GFGLQEIFANFVSGLILLFERPIRVGDFVTVGGVTGEVTQIRIRATTVRNFARQELIVPNKEFITGQVMNWTLSDTLTRFIVSVGVAYGSDVTLVCQTLLRLAAANELVLADPAPRVFFKEFGDNALVIELRVFVASLDFMVDANNSMHIAVEKEFRRLGIEIAFPQRDIHIRGIEGVLALQREPHRSQDGRQSEGAP
ncbi:MAG: mechanosensitive ion channel, partial [Planctomycetes bacterium]|nr:mechanosensitive ion channel [Planctomycetota bacterium]